MLILHISIFVLILLLYLVARFYKNISFSNLDQKEHPFLFFYPISYFLLFHTPIQTFFYKETKQVGQFRALYTRDDPKERKMLHWCSKIALAIVIILIFNGISMGIILMDSNKGNLIGGSYILRPGYGEGEKEVNLQVGLEGDESTETQNISIEIENQKYSQEQVNALFAKTKKYIDQVILGENTSREDIQMPLNLIRRMPGTEISIDWELEEAWIDEKGGIHNQEVKEPGILTEVRAVLKYGEYKEEYSTFLMIKPKKTSKEEYLLQKLINQILSIQKNTQTQKKITLPKKVENYTISYSEDRPSKSSSLLLIGLIAAVSVIYMKDLEIEKSMKKREVQMLMDYPEIMNKFSLLLGAGMTIKGAWTRIASEYSESLERDGKRRRFAYEEIVITWRELNNGVTEVTAFDNFGKRVKLLPYLKFSSLISQNLKKGAKGLLELLELEAVEAFEERKELAKRLGEEAGTKLLVPMMIMLIIVLFLILIPAFMTL